jgi:hypothetical protein
MIYSVLAILGLTGLVASKRTTGSQGRMMQPRTLNYSLVKRYAESSPGKIQSIAIDAQNWNQLTNENFDFRVFKNLTKLEIKGQSNKIDNLDKISLKGLGFDSGLKELRLEFVAIENPESLEDLKNLESISLVNCNIYNWDLIQFEKMRNLDRIQIYYTPNACPFMGTQVANANQILEQYIRNPIVIPKEVFQKKFLLIQSKMPIKIPDNITLGEKTKDINITGVINSNFPIFNGNPGGLKEIELMPFGLTTKALKVHPRIFIENIQNFSDHKRAVKAISKAMSRWNRHSYQKNRNKIRVF